MKKTKTIYLFLLMFCVLIKNDSYVHSKNQNIQQEKICKIQDHNWVERCKYGIIEKEVDEVCLGSETNFWELVIKKNNAYKNVVLSQKKKGKYQQIKIGGKNLKKVYPLCNGGISIDRKDNVLFSSVDHCDFFVDHKNENECRKAFRVKNPWINQIVEKNVKKTWANNGFFAYVKNNTLYITGSIWGGIVNKGLENCCNYETMKACFAGRGNEVQQVVSGENERRANLFVLLKDGSVWGIGDNTKHQLSNSNTKNYFEFIQIVKKGVLGISACSNNVCIIKNNKTLWVWGRTIKSGRKKYTFQKNKIADNVTEVSATDTKGKTSIIFKTQDNRAYGIGYNGGTGIGKCFTNRYQSGWHRNPVLLMSNVKHVYAADSSTLILTKKNTLYWSGTQEWTGAYKW